jgi:NADH:ubiquinone reductase (H+-translocating)
MPDALPFPRLVIVGGGFAGVSAARAGVAGGYRVTVVDSKKHTEFQPLLYQVAVGVLPPETLRTPIQNVLGANVTFVHGTLTAVNDAAGEILLTDGSVIGYDTLIIAVGSVPNDYGINGVTEHAYFLNSVDDAVRLREQLHQVLTNCGRVIIVGGGATGVELAGAIADEMGSCMKGGCGAMRVTLLEATDTLLPGFTKEAQQYTKRHLRTAGVDVRFKSIVTRVTQDTVRLTDGTLLHGDIIIWTAGQRGNPTITNAGLPTDTSGRIIVNTDFRVIGNERIYAVGDAAATGTPHVAQAAKQTATHAIRTANAARNNENTPPFTYRNPGKTVIINRGAAVLEIPTRNKTTLILGWLAWLTWLTVHLTHLPGTQNRLTTLRTWLTDSLTPRPRKRSMREG